ncbi:ATP-binding protein [Mucilaginibacter sp.]|uniref:ATP-binding protein n=1 Tax=Mucilaginibacter sp. TaxID=1882438 RepID=UPI0035BC535F
MLASCGDKSKPATTVGYTPGFENAVKTVDKYWAKGQIKEGLLYLDSAFKKLNSPSVNDKFRFYSLHYVYYQKTVSHFDTASVYADSMLIEAAKSKNTKLYAMNVAEASFCKGDALFEMRQFTDAYQSYYQGYLIGKNYVNIAALGDYTYRMGMIMYKKAHYQLAAKYFKVSYIQNLEDAKEVERGFVGFYRRQELLDNIGLSYRHNNQNDSAIVYFDKALFEIEKNLPVYKSRRQHLDMARGVVYGNKAEVYIQTGEYDKAAELLKKSIAINLSNGYDNRDAELSEIKLGRVYERQHKSDSLINLLTNLRRQLDTVKNEEAEADYNRLLSGYYAQQGKLKEALNYLQIYTTQKDSLNKMATSLMETNVDQQTGNYEKQHEIDKLSTDNKLQVIYLYVTVFFGVMALFIIFLIFRNYKRSKKDVKTVNLLNKQINEQNVILENALNELNNSSQEKDRILRTVAHDLRNPIGGIASLTAMMADDEYTEEQKELINLVKETSFNSLELINEILEATNISSIRLNLEQVEINSLVSNSVELLRFKAAEKGQQIMLQTLGKQQELYISREKIWRVISNLVSNAIKFSPTGAAIQVSVIEEKEQVLIAVEDNGIGIPDKLKDQVFNMFTSAQRPGTAGEKSFGLGLSICRQIIEKHNGKIWFEGKATPGTIFYISLPLSGNGIDVGLPQKVSVPVS